MFGDVSICKASQKTSGFFTGRLLNNPSSVLSKLHCDTLFSSDAMMQGKFGVTFVMEKVVFWSAGSPVIKSIFLFGHTTCGLVSWELRVGIGCAAEPK